MKIWRREVPKPKREKGPQTSERDMRNLRALAGMLRRRRENLGLTQAEVARRMLEPGEGPEGRYRMQLGAWERGKVNPTTTNLMRWMSALDLMTIIRPDYGDEDDD